MIWRPFFDHLGKDAEIFTNVFYDFYYAPSGFQVDARNNDAPVIDNVLLETYNVDKKAEQLKDFLVGMNETYRTNHLFLPWGGDFWYSNAMYDFDSTDRLIKYFNKQGYNFTLKYSTPSQYVKAVHDADIEWPTNYDDMMPYADRSNDYWSGYFTSRPNLKEYIRKTSKQFHAQSKLFALGVLNSTVADMDVEAVMNSTMINFDAIGVTQHHDAITGTSKQLVADDYAERLYKALTMTSYPYKEVIHHEAVIRMNFTGSSKDWQMCNRTNATYLDCATSTLVGQDNKDFIIAIHNPAEVAHRVSQIKAPPGVYNVTYWNEMQGMYMNTTFQTICDDFLLDNMTKIDTCDIFVIHEIAPMSVAFFNINFKKSTDNEHRLKQEPVQIGEGVVNKYFELAVEGIGLDGLTFQ